MNIYRILINVWDTKLFAISKKYLQPKLKTNAFKTRCNYYFLRYTNTQALNEYRLNFKSYKNTAFIKINLQKFIFVML